MFVETKAAFMIPMARIKYAKRMRDHVEIVDDDGDGHSVSYDAWSTAEMTPSHTWAAAPGTYILEVGGDVDFTVYRQVVFGWCITVDRLVYPITDQGVNNGTGLSQTVLHPCGKVESFDQNWSTYGEWEEQERDRFASRSKGGSNG